MDATRHAKVLSGHRRRTHFLERREWKVDPVELLKVRGCDRRPEEGRLFRKSNAALQQPVHAQSTRGPNLVDQHELRAEALYRESAVVDRGAQAARRPVALVGHPAQLAAGAHGEAPRQGDRDPGVHPAAGMAPSLCFGTLPSVSYRRIGPHGRGYHPGPAQREIHDRPVQELQCSVPAVVPGCPGVRRHQRAEPVSGFGAYAEIKMIESAAAPAAPGIGQQAHLGVLARPPARPGLARHEQLIELSPRIVPPREAATDVQPQPVIQPMLIFPARPHRDAHARCRQIVHVAAARPGPRRCLFRQTGWRSPEMAALARRSTQGWRGTGRRPPPGRGGEGGWPSSKVHPDLIGLPRAGVCHLCPRGGDIPSGNRSRGDNVF